MFLNPTMLAGLGGAMLPLVLHLLARWRYRNVDWGAMMFLFGTDLTQRHSARLRQWLLLALRMAMVGLLAVALARPVTRGAWGTPAGGGPVSAVIILDRSYSMDYQASGRSRMQLAQEAALAVLTGLRPGDRAAVISAGGAAEAPPAQLSTDLQSVARQIMDPSPPAGSADIAVALLRAADVLDQGGPTGAREVYIICDNQARSWDGVGASLANTWRARQQAHEIRLVVVPVGGQESDNAALVSLELLTQPVVRDTPTLAQVQIRNYAYTAKEVPLSLWLCRDGRPDQRLHAGPVRVEADAMAAVRLPVVFSDLQPAVLSARIEAGGLKADDRFDLPVQVMERLRVLILTGDQREGAGFAHMASFAELALAPYRRRGGDLADVAVRRLDEWPAGGFREFAVVILGNVPEFSITQARALEQYVYGGGGLIIAGGGLCRVENYNTRLFRNERGLLPARLGQPRIAAWENALPIARYDSQHPALRFLADAPAPQAAVAGYLPALLRSDARALAWLGDDQPLLIEGGFGGGRVLLLTTSLDLEWTNLPLSNAYLPLLQSMVRYLGSSAGPARGLLTGQPLVAIVKDPPDERHITVRPPDGRTMNRAALSVASVGQRWQISYGDTRVPGWYRMQVGAQDLWFVVQSPRHESDLTCLSSQRWQGLMQLLDMQRLGEPGRALDRQIAAARGGRELWLPCILCVLILGVVELWVARPGRSASAN